MFMSSLYIYQHLLFAPPLGVKSSNTGMFISLLCIYNTFLYHCYGYTNMILWHFSAHRFLLSPQMWNGRTQVRLCRFYVHNKICLCHRYVYTNNYYLHTPTVCEIVNTGMSISLLCIYNTILYHCYGYANIDFMGNLLIYLWQHYGLVKTDGMFMTVLCI